MEFEYNEQLQAQNSIDIENIGDFGIEAIDEDGCFYYLAVRTLLGMTLIASCGPIIPDIDILPNGYKCSLSKMAYKEDKLGKTINYWLNDKAKKIVNASEISFEESVLQFKELSKYLINLSEDTI